MPFRKFPGKMNNRIRTQEMFGAPLEDLDQDYLVAHIDGGARGNPGPAGYGVVIEDHAGRRIDQLSRYIGEQTNNVAEYSALVAALEYALGHGFMSLKILSDSELLVKQIRGEYKVRSEALVGLYKEAKELISRLDSFQIRHIPREQNREADKLANLAMDKGTGRKPVVESVVVEEEVTGVVTGGVVHFLKGSFPEGAQVVIRRKK